MPGVAQTGTHAGSRCELLIVGDLLYLAETAERLTDRVEWLAALALCVLLLDVSAVREHHLEEVGGRFGRIDGPVKPFVDQAWNQPRVIDVGVGEQHEVECRGIEVERRPVLRERFMPTLKHAAVDQEAQAAGVYQEAGAGDFTRSAEKGDSHDPALYGLDAGGHSCRLGLVRTCTIELAAQRLEC